MSSSLGVFCPWGGTYQTEVACRIPQGEEQRVICSSGYSRNHSTHLVSSSEPGTTLEGSNIRRIREAGTTVALGTRYVTGPFFQGWPWCFRVDDKPFHMLLLFLLSSSLVLLVVLLFSVSFDTRRQYQVQRVQVRKGDSC